MSVCQQKIWLKSLPNQYDFPGHDCGHDPVLLLPLKLVIVYSQLVGPSNHINININITKVKIVTLLYGLRWERIVLGADLLLHHLLWLKLASIYLDIITMMM